MSQKRFVYSCYFVSFITHNIIFNFINIEYFIGPFRVILLSVGVSTPFLLEHFYLVVLLYFGILSFVFSCSLRLTFTFISLSSLCASDGAILVDE